MIGDNGDLVRGFGQLGPIAGDQPLVEAVKCGRAVFSEALRSLTLASRRIAYPIFSAIRNDDALSSSIPSVR